MSGIVGNPSKRITAKDTASAAFAGTTVTATEKSLGVKMGAYDQFGFWLDISTITGTSPTLDISFQWSEDSSNGVDGTWTSIVENRQGSQTAAAMAQITTTTGANATFFVNPSSIKGWVRANLTVSGTSPVYTVDSMYWILKDAAQG